MPRQRKRRASNKNKFDMIVAQTMQSADVKRVVGYCRVSTKDQVTKGDIEKVSLEHQQAEIIKWASYKGYELVDMYIDAGESGAKEDRTELTRMLRDAEEGKFDIVVVYSPDRFSRKMRIAMESMYHLEDLGVGIKFLNPDFDTMGHAGKLLFSFYSHFAEQDRLNIKQRLLMGKKDKLMKGNYISRKPYGYKVFDGKLEIVPEEAEVVERIFKWKAFDKKMSLRKIAEQLNKEGIPSPSGKKWSYVSVNNILKNELYCGKFMYTIEGKTVEIDMDYQPIVAPQVWGRANSN